MDQVQVGSATFSIAMGKGQRPNGSNTDASHGNELGMAVVIFGSPIPNTGLASSGSCLRGAREKLLWQKAAQHRHGAGMEGGIDMKLVSKHYNWYIKHGKMRQAGAIMAICTGAMWPGSRLGPEDPMYKCPMCGDPGYDEVHMFYACPRL
eukprot:7211777-Karenia_brevis.AAC.1